jgi:hypothetical protein
VRAHSVQEASLRAIAQDGKVYGYRIDLATFGATGVRIEKIGVRKASAFTGFCSRHDDQVFAKLEKEPFVARPDQVAALHYRVLARELYAKESQAGTYDFLDGATRGSGLPLEFSAGVETGLRDSRYWAEMSASVIN